MRPTHNMTATMQRIRKKGKKRQMEMVDVEIVSMGANS